MRTVNISQTSLVLTQYAKFMEQPGFELSLDKFGRGHRGCGVILASEIKSIHNQCDGYRADMEPRQLEKTSASVGKIAQLLKGLP